MRHIGHVEVCGVRGGAGDLLAAVDTADRSSDRRRRRLAWTAYFAGLLLISTVVALGDTPPITMFGVTVPPFLQGLLFWAINLSFSPFLLLFLNRAVRSIGPALLAMMLVAMLGGTLAIVAASTPAGMAAVGSVLWALGLPQGKRRRVCMERVQGEMCAPVTTG